MTKNIPDDLHVKNKLKINKNAPSRSTTSVLIKILSISS